MLRHGRRTEEDVREAAFTLPSMPLVAQVLGSCLDGDTRVVRATDGWDSVGLRPRTVRAVHGVLQQLSQREEQVVRMRYGIGTRRHSIDEISERIGVIPPQVERIELRAFRKLRETSVAEDLFEQPATLTDPHRGGGRRPPLPAEPPQSPDEPDANPWDEV